MKTVILTRVSDDGKQTLGTISVAGDTGQLFSSDTLELPWKNNMNEVSCIPQGNYVCRYTRSNRLSALHGADFFTYEVLNVFGREGIRIHSANYFSQLLGCIALGKKSADMNNDGEEDVAGSRDTIKAFEGAMNGEDFSLIVSAAPVGRF